MPIVFQPPIVGFNPTDKSKFKDIPNLPGVYIVGVKIDVDDCDGNKVNKFCPLYVGEASNLSDRICAHWKSKGGYLNQKKELFDLCKNTISEIYQDIKLWNLSHWNFSLRGSKPLLYNSIAGSNNSLIFFNCNTFFDFYLRVPAGTSGYISDKSWHNGAVADLTILGTTNSIKLGNKINDVKNIIDNNFYFAYWIETNLDDRLIIEGATKKALEKLNIHTYSDAKYFPGTYNIDFSIIQTDLVNLTSAPFVSPLIITV